MNILADLWNCPRPASRPPACSTTGSSEAAMLGGLALKWRWRERMQAAGQADRPAEPGDGRQRPGVLGEVLPLLGRRAAPGADGGRPLSPRRRRRPPRGVTRTRSASSRSSARPSTAATSRSPRSARRSTSSRPTGGPDVPIHVDARLGRVRRAVPPARPRVGLPARRGCSRSTPPATSTVSCTRASAGRSGATRRRSRGPGVRRQLPRRERCRRSR